MGECVRDLVEFKRFSVYTVQTERFWTLSMLLSILQ